MWALPAATTATVLPSLEIAKSTGSTIPGMGGVIGGDMPGAIGVSAGWTRPAQGSLDP